METKSIEVWLRNTIASFAVARHGSLAIVFEVAAMPLMLAVGAAFQPEGPPPGPPCRLRWIARL